VLLLDSSAWSRLRGEQVPQLRADVIADLSDSGQLAVCLPFLLEAGFSARSIADRTAIMRRLERFPRITIDHDVERLALRAQRELTEAGHHCLAPTDVLIAACAHTAEAGVLHYDRDYDLLLEHTSLDFASEWLAPPGSLRG
jgi:hypothetical protein